MNAWGAGIDLSALAIRDPFDPRGWPVEAPDDTCYLSLSGRIDCIARLDREDYEWAIGPNPAEPVLWCHSYGSGSMSEETWTIDRPDCIYARRSVPMPGLTPSGRPRYGNLWLHRAILTRACGPAPRADMVGDHINGDTLDNRRINLRWADKIMNARNVKGSQVRARLVAEQEALAQLIAAGPLAGEALFSHV